MEDIDIVKSLYNDDRIANLQKLFGLKRGRITNNEFVNNFELCPYDAYRITMMNVASYLNLKSDNILENKLRTMSKGLLDDLPNAKMFMVSEKLKFLMRLTKPASLKISFVNLPFEHLFFDVDLKIDEHTRVFGILVSNVRDKYKELLVNMKENPIIKSTNPSLHDAIKEVVSDISSLNLISVTFCYFTDYEEYSGEVLDEGIFLLDGFLYDLDELYFIKKSFKRPDLTKKEAKKMDLLMKTISDFVSNMLLFLNEPRIKVYSKPDVENAERRLKKGKIALPSLLITRIETGLAEYIDRVYFTGQSHSKLGYAFWVRGHWMLFQSDRYVNMKGGKIWIAPYLKGEGIIPPQVFVVGRN